METVKGISEILKWLVFFWFILCLSTGGFTCDGTTYKLEACNPSEGVYFFEKY